MLNGWEEGLHPRKPVIKEGYLYGRGASDDGYATYAIVESIKLIQQTGGKHGKIIIAVEGDEESGSADLIYYLKKLESRIGQPDLMICMDSGCMDYDSLWITTSLRGYLEFTLTVECLKENVHSGSGSGIAPDSFNIIRSLLDRLDDKSHSVLIDIFHVVIPEHNIQEAKKLANLKKDSIVKDSVKLLPNVKPLSDDYSEIILNNTWRPTLVITGFTGFPQTEIAGNVLRNKTTCRVAIRLPPTANAKSIETKCREIMTSNPPFNCKITLSNVEAGYGWAAKELPDVLKDSFNKSSKTLFGREFFCFGEGGSIGFIHDLGELYPDCQMLVTGVLGPKTNAHCPNECLNIDYTEKITVALAHTINDYCC